MGLGCGIQWVQSIMVKYPQRGGRHPPPPTNMSRLIIIVIVNLMKTGSSMFVLKRICNNKIKQLYYNK